MDGSIKNSLGLFHRVNTDLPKFSESEMEDYAKDKILDDLNLLLGSRRPFKLPDEKHKEVLSSVVYYGLPDFSGFQISDEEQQDKIREYLIFAINTFEKRLKNIHVELVPNSDFSEKGSIQFKITGQLDISNQKPPVQINAFWSESVGHFKFKGI